MKLSRPLQALVPYGINGIVRLVRRSMRIRYLHRESIDRLMTAGRPFILAFWHNQQFLMRYAYPGKRITILISRHRDGDLAANTMRLFGLDVTRGSTTEGGAAGLRQLVRRVREGYSLAFTPDGPRGPNQVAKAGVVQAARLAGIPIVPVAFGASKKKF